MTDTSIGAIVYAAKSTKDRHMSIPEQLDDCREMCAENGWDVVSEYSDENFTAYTGNRGPGLAAAIAAAKELAAAQGSAMIVAQHTSRFARGDGASPRAPRALVELWHEWARANVEGHTVENDYALRSSSAAAQQGEADHNDSKRKGKSVRKGIRRRARDRGRFVGGRRPYGYRHRDTTEDGKGTGPLVIVEAEGTIVRRIFAEYLAGRAQNRIARDLIADGVPTLTPSGSWYATTVAGMLKNSLYVGQITLNGEHFPAVDSEGNPTHQPIIDTVTWDAACQLREARTSNGRPRGRRTAGRHLLTEGLLRCTCGAAMSPRTVKDRRGHDYTYEVYVCVKKLHHGPDACRQLPIKRELIDNRIYSYFHHVALDVDGTRRAHQEDAARKLSEFDALCAQAAREVAKVEEALTRIERDYIAGRITPEQWARFESKLTADLEASRAQVEQHDTQRQAIAVGIAEFDADAVIADELAQLARLVAGQVQEGSRNGIESFRATLKKLFVGFELTSPDNPFGAGVLSGQVWTEATPSGDVPTDPMLSLGNGRALLPVVRAQVIDWNADQGDGFPAVQRVALALSDNLYSRLAA